VFNVQVKAETQQERKERLKTAEIVAVTCCSAFLPILDDLSFDFCILDEGSQIVEPLALVPLWRAKSRYRQAAVS
jgi:superfamily I DNA and/or RNA helicase